MEHDFRVSDADRDRAARDLREHFAAGRLSEDELDQRVQAAYSARTSSELGALLIDLPRLPVTPAQRKAELAERRSHLQRRLLQESGGGLVLFAICTAIWATSDGNHGSFWPGWVLLVVILPLIRNAWRLYGPAPDLDRVEEYLARRRQRDRGRRR
jgi:hypothetical protein